MKIKKNPTLKERKKEVEIVALRAAPAAAAVGSAFGEAPPDLCRHTLKVGGRRIASSYPKKPRR